MENATQLEMFKVEAIKVERFYIVGKIAVLANPHSPSGIVKALCEQGIDLRDVDLLEMKAQAIPRDELLRRGFRIDIPASQESYLAVPDFSRVPKQKSVYGNFIDNAYASLA